MGKTALLFILIRIVAIAWLLNGIGHWLIILRICPPDKAPKIMEYFFRSCAIINPLIAFGLWNLMGWARMLGIFVVSIHLFFHGGLLIQQVSQKIPLEKWRFLELAMAVFFLIFANLKVVKDMLH